MMAKGVAPIRDQCALLESASMPMAKRKAKGSSGGFFSGIAKSIGGIFGGKKKEMELETCTASYNRSPAPVTIQADSIKFESRIRSDRDEEDEDEDDEMDEGIDSTVSPYKSKDSKESKSKAISTVSIFKYSSLIRF